ncbi:NAD-P-binding protein [Multifurca ochricompacta]|uniref:NAD-P-binding protein n=1 Tax=Multifurca ochricompacta TaxID=376703 RepID=A0AAD4QL61_9AGAM|nr:NAD-P-binding protein [Multifurca ochricompacta]
MDLDLKDVHVLVTGANGGIGLETTRLFLEHGARVTAQYRTSNTALVQLLVPPSTGTGNHRFYPSGPRLRMVQADLTNEAQVQALFSTATATATPSPPAGVKWGEVEVAVINHGVSVSADVPLRDMPLEQWERTFSNNLTSSFLVAREYMRRLELGVRGAAGDEDGVGWEFGQRAAIVFVGSTAGKYGEALHADYAASKSAIMYGLTLSLKNEIVQIAPRARVNCVAPGWVRTPMAHEALQNPKTVYRALATTPLRKVAEATDVANQIVFLASAKVSGHITGQVLMVEGGMEGRLLNTTADIGLSLPM